jgi:5-amino-6-(5-phosphoribosylamino)uracil reductase
MPWAVGRVAEHPYTLLSCAVSLDGCLDDTTDQRLVLSNEADLDRVDGVRAGCDAILVGAGTVRADDPRLSVRAAGRRTRRVAEGRAPTPRKVTLTRHPGLDPHAAIFRGGDGDPLVYCATGAVAGTRERLGEAATVVDAGADPQVDWVSTDLAARGVRRLMVEGGQGVLTQFLRADLADELQLVVAPVLVGDARAPRLVGDPRMPAAGRPRAHLAEVRRIDDVVLLRYALSPRFEPDDQGGTTR